MKQRSNMPSCWISLLLLFTLVLTACQPIAPIMEEAANEAANTEAANSESAQPAVPEVVDPPNILFIVIDDAGYSDFGSFGSEIPTPNLDRLAQSGLTFTNFHTAPSCSPTRSELLTGQDHHGAGFGNMGEDITDQQRGQPGYEGYLNERTLPISQLLNDNGYHTYMSGKWHLGRPTEGHIPSNIGFEESVALVQGFGGHFGIQPAWPDGDQIYIRNGEPIELPEDFYSSTYYTDNLIEFIESNRADGQPWFSFLSYTAPHDPMQAPAEWVEQFDGMYDEGYTAIHDARLERMIELGIVPADTTAAPYPEHIEFAPWEGLSAEEQGRMSKGMEVYAAMIAKLDEEVGRLLTYLEETGEMENTWIFTFSDNGPNGEGQNAYFTEDFLDATYDDSEAAIGTAESFFLYGGGWGWASATPLRGYKGYPTEGGIRAPLFINGPGLERAGELTANYAEVTDLYPSVLNLAGIEFPEAHNGVELLPLPGASMIPYAMGLTETVHGEEAYFGEELWGRASLRKGDWKILWLCPPVGTGEWQLFNVSTDLAEVNDLAEENPEKLAELVADYESYVSGLGIIGDLGVLPWDYTAGITEACPTPGE